MKTDLKHKFTSSFVNLLLILCPMLLLFSCSTQSDLEPEHLCDNMEEDWIFCDDFSNGDLSRWDHWVTPENPNRTVIEDPGPLELEGNHVVRIRVPEGRGGVGVNKTLPNVHDVMYVRQYMAYEEGFDFTARNHGGGISGGDRHARQAGHRPKGDDVFRANIEYLPATDTDPARTYIYSYYRGMKMDCADPEGMCWGDHLPCMISDSYCDRVPELRVDTYPPPLEHERWYCVEMKIDAGTPVDSEDEADGVMNLWVDNLEIGPWEGRWLRTSPDVKPNHFHLGLFHHAEHSVEGIKFDDVVVSTSRIGCHD